MVAAVESVLHEIGADEIPVELVLNKIDAVDALGRRRLANRFPGRAPDLGPRPARGSTSCAARLAERFARRFELVRLLLPYDRGRPARGALRLGAPIDEREDTAGRRPRPRPPAAAATLRRFAPYLDRRGAGAQSIAERVIELPITRLRPDAVVPERAYAGDAGLDLAACERVELGARRARDGRHRASRSRSRRATPASSSRAPASPRATGSRSSTRPA